MSAVGGGGGDVLNVADFLLSFLFYFYICHVGNFLVMSFIVGFLMSG